MEMLLSILFFGVAAIALASLVSSIRAALPHIAALHAAMGELSRFREVRVRRWANGVFRAPRARVAARTRPPLQQIGPLAARRSDRLKQRGGWQTPCGSWAAGQHAARVDNMEQI